MNLAYVTAFETPDLIVACIVGVAAAETGPPATAWHSNKFLNPARDGTVPPILHLYGYKFALGGRRPPFDMVVMNNLDRFHLADDVIDRLPHRGSRAAYSQQAIHDMLMEHREHIAQHGVDLPSHSGWKWGEQAVSADAGTSTEGDNAWVVSDRARSRHGRVHSLE